MQILHPPRKSSNRRDRYAVFVSERRDLRLIDDEHPARFDVPAIGTATIESMIAAGAKALAIEAGRVLVVDQAKVAALADENGIAIAAI